MPLSINEIKDRAAKFAARWKNAVREEADAQEFEIDFLDVFGITRRKVATFEKKVRKLDGTSGYIDLFWKGTLLIEMKSRGKDLDRAARQAREYVESLPQNEIPRGVLVCDFERFHYYDLEDGLDAAEKKTVFSLAEFPDRVELFTFIAGYQKRVYREQDPANLQAAELMGRAHDALKEAGYEGRPLEIYLARLLFCMFADDTSIFGKDDMLFYLKERTAEDGSDLGAKLSEFFYVLNTPPEKRLRTLDEQLNEFPYVNGGLFAETLPPAAFDAATRALLIECCELDWGKISPAIFGALFQCAMNPEARRNLGAHYTSEKNILKAIHPLFLDGLRAEFDRLKELKIGKSGRLKTFQKKLAALKFLDPACGCGNFLVVAYRELRLLEIDVLKELYAVGERFLDISTMLKVDVDQFFGIEIEEFPAQIARVALWLTDHQMNLKARDVFGEYFVRIPLKTSPTIVCANALRIDWETVVPKSELSYILGNPPFVGFTYMSPEQKADMATIFPKCKILDFVTAWYKKSAEYIQGTEIEVAFVSTNSICQGEAVAPLWNSLFQQDGVVINFAHQTFKWSNEARGAANVFCVVVGFALFERANKSLYVYETVKSEPHLQNVKQINAYLVDGPNVIVESRNKALEDVPPMVYGNKPVDGGNLIIEEKDLDDFLRREPGAQKFIKNLLGGVEFINNKKRYCLWLVGAEPSEIKKTPLVIERVARCRAMREASVDAGARKLAKRPTEFRDTNNPKTFLAVPRISSERRRYIPIGFLDDRTIATDLLQTVPNATLYHFGVLTSAMHMTWTRYVCGRLKSDYRYSKDIVYNNFPWPRPDESLRAEIESAGQGVLDARALFPDSSLADLYDPNTTPRELTAAHDKLDRLVDKAYRPRKFASDAERVAFLFERYLDLTGADASESRRSAATGGAAESPTDFS